MYHGRCGDRPWQVKRHIRPKGDLVQGSLLPWDSCFCPVTSLPININSRRGATDMPGLVVAQCMLSYRPVVAIAVILSSFGSHEQRAYCL